VTLRRRNCDDYAEHFNAIGIRLGALKAQLKYIAPRRLTCQP